MDRNLSNLMNSVRKGHLRKVRRLIGSYDVSDSRNWSEGYDLLCTAIEHNRTDIAKLLITNGARVNSENPNPSYTPLYLAVRNHDVEIVKMLLNTSANVNAKIRGGVTPLIISVKYRNNEITRLLLNQGADINVSDHDGMMPLHIAAENRNVQIAKDLLNLGAYINSPCTLGWRDGYTPLHFACGSHIYQGDDPQEIIKFLLSNNADINAVTKDDVMPLWFATMRGHDTAVKLLLENGATVDTQYTDGKTILHLAAERGYLIITEHILKYLPDVNNESNRTSLHAAIHGIGEKYTAIVEILLKSGFTVDSVDVNNCQLLYDAVARGYLTIVEALLNYGADVNMSLKDNKKTPLHSATENNRVELAKLLIKSGADVNAKDKDDRGPIYYAAAYNKVQIAELLLTNGVNIKDIPEVLHEAVKKGCRKIVELFIQRGADINASDKDGRTALHFTALGPFRFTSDILGEIAKLLVKGGANINAQTENGITPLHAAIEHGYVTIVETLLSNGADINSQQKDGITALHIATDLGNKRVVKVLLERSAKIVSEIKKRLTPLHIAAQHGYLKIVRILLDFGADIDSRDEEGRTALHIACEARWENVIFALLGNGSHINNINIESVVYDFEMKDADYCYPQDFNSDSDFYNYHNESNKRYNEYNHYCDSVVLDFKYSRFDNYDYREGEILRGEELAEILHKRIIMMRTVNFYVSEENLNWLRTSQPVENFASKCEEETERMKGEKIGNVSFYDFLTVEDINQLAMYVKNENVEQVFKSVDYIRKFPVYARMIYYCFKKGVERKKLLEQSITFFHSLFNSLPELPYSCTEQIVSYLNNTDLRTLIDTYYSLNTDTSK